MFDDPVEVSKCDGLRSLIASSAAKHLVQLTRLGMTEVFAEPHKLLLGDHAFSSPSLEVVVISRCPEMRIFSHALISTPKLDILLTEEGYPVGWRAAMDTRRTTFFPLDIISPVNYATKKTEEKRLFSRGFEGIFLAITCRWVILLESSESNSFVYMFAHLFSCELLGRRCAGVLQLAPDLLNQELES
uniref:Uncharacterized protein n=1 Tax=Salix viminalis TaxID=40686 RepID=A0A6N2LDI2_SALVM